MKKTKVTEAQIIGILKEQEQEYQPPNDWAAFNFPYQ